MTENDEKRWTIEVVAYDSGQSPGIRDDGKPSGELKPVDIDKLLEAVGDLAERAGRKLNALEVTPSELTIEGDVALQVSAELPCVLQFGVDTGLLVSMTWRFEDSNVRIMPMRRKSPPGPPAPPEDPAE